MKIFLKSLLNFPWKNNIINYFFCTFGNFTKNDIGDFSCFRRSTDCLHGSNTDPALSTAAAGRIAFQARRLCFLLFSFSYIFQDVLRYN